MKKTEKKRRGEHPRSLANLVTWQPGQTGNPGEGRAATQEEMEGGKNRAINIIIDMPMPGMPMLPAKPANGSGNKSLPELTDLVRSSTHHFHFDVFDVKDWELGDFRFGSDSV